MVYVLRDLRPACSCRWWKSHAIFRGIFHGFHVRLTIVLVPFDPLKLPCPPEECVIMSLTFCTWACQQLPWKLSGKYMHCCFGGSLHPFPGSFPGRCVCPRLRGSSCHGQIHKTSTCFVRGSSGSSFHGSFHGSFRESESLSRKISRKLTWDSFFRAT